MRTAPSIAQGIGAYTYKFLCAAIEILALERKEKVSVIESVGSADTTGLFNPLKSLDKENAISPIISQKFCERWEGAYCRRFSWNSALEAGKRKLLVSTGEKHGPSCGVSQPALMSIRPIEASHSGISPIS